jgi:hypothetical protein
VRLQLSQRNADFTADHVNRRTDHASAGPDHADRPKQATTHGDERG